jgi:hypothetical protein
MRVVILRKDQTMDYAKDPQEYGGFSLLKEEDRQKILDLVFGDDGLRVGLLKMFHDPFHQTTAGGEYDHATTTKWLRYFAREGLKKTRAAGRDLSIITTLYGPPAYMTRQKIMRGRDLDPAHKRDLALYLVAGIDLLRAKRPELHAWVTSTSWSQMDARNIKEHHGNIYTAKVNAIIPWAGIQRTIQWTGGDPNPGSAFTVSENGTYEVRPGYHMYKQITRAGQPGMAVARATAMDSGFALIAFAANGTNHPDAVVLVNLSKTRTIRIKVKGTSASSFAACRTTEDGHHQYAGAGTFSLEEGALVYDAPGGSVTTFFAEP